MEICQKCRSKLLKCLISHNIGRIYSRTDVPPHPEMKRKMDGTTRQHCRLVSELTNVNQIYIYPYIFIYTHSLMKSWSFPLAFGEAWVVYPTENKWEIKLLFHINITRWSIFTHDCNFFPVTNFSGCFPLFCPFRFACCCKSYSREVSINLSLNENKSSKEVGRFLFNIKWIKAQEKKEGKTKMACLYFRF